MIIDHQAIFKDALTEALKDESLEIIDAELVYAIGSGSDGEKRFRVAFKPKDEVPIHITKV